MNYEQVWQIWRRCAPPFLSYLRKTGGGHNMPPSSARVNSVSRYFILFFLYLPYFIFAFQEMNAISWTTNQLRVFPITWYLSALIGYRVLTQTWNKHENTIKARYFLRKCLISRVMISFQKKDLKLSYTKMSSIRLLYLKKTCNATALII